jgi:hypothetical protein
MQAGSYFHYKNDFPECMFLFRVDFHVHNECSSTTLKKQMSHDRLLLHGVRGVLASHGLQICYGACGARTQQTESRALRNIIGKQGARNIIEFKNKSAVRPINSNNPS